MTRDQFLYANIVSQQNSTTVVIKHTISIGYLWECCTKISWRLCRQFWSTRRL